MNTVCFISFFFCHYVSVCAYVTGNSGSAQSFVKEHKFYCQYVILDTLEQLNF